MAELSGETGELMASGGIIRRSGRNNSGNGGNTGQNGRKKKRSGRISKLPILRNRIGVEKGPFEHTKQL